MKTSNILITEPATDYELIDSGEGEKLERFGNIVLSRPDPQALWHKKLPTQEWHKANGSFSRDAKGADWLMKSGTPDRWSIDFADLKFYIKPTAFKHVGIFPEQSMNWKWLRETIGEAIKSKTRANKESVGEAISPTFPSLSRETKEKLAQPKGLVSDENSFEVLNLFGYTGGASLACAQAGAKVVHIDGSKSAIAWARENAELSGLADKPIRWIMEDARTFVGREIKRGRKYDGIIMDPPAFGHGPDNELWKIEEHFLKLVDDCFSLLRDKSADGTDSVPSLFLINGYSAGYSAIAYENILLPLVERFGGKIEIGELSIKERSKIESESIEIEKNTNEMMDEEQSRVLPCGIFARWEAGK